MRVLLTGFTLRQCGLTENINQYATIFAMLPDALRAGGHEVDQRAVVPGEDLSGRYDVALIGVHPMASMSSSRKFGACWAATQVPYVLMFQDWKVKLSVDHLKTPNYMWKSSHLQGQMLRDFELAAPHSLLMDRVRARWSRIADACLLPMHAWADPGQMTKLSPNFTRPFAWDVSPWLPEFSTGAGLSMGDKDRSWVLASLSNQDAWLDGLEPQPTWPVEKIYKPEASNTVQIRDSFVPEAELVDQRFTAHAGALFPHYGRECLQGWWRSRPQFVSQARSVLWGNASDLSGFGDGYWQPLSVIERMHVSELAQLAELQRQLVNELVIGREASARELTRALETCVQEPVRP